PAGFVSLDLSPTLPAAETRLAPGIGNHRSAAIGHGRALGDDRRLARRPRNDVGPLDNRIDRRHAGRHLAHSPASWWSNPGRRWGLGGAACSHAARELGTRPVDSVMHGRFRRANEFDEPECTRLPRRGGTAGRDTL